MAEERIEGRLSRILFRKPGADGDTWYIGLLSDGTKFTVATRTPISKGLSIALEGRYENSQKWGEQFKANRVEILGLTESDQGLLSWLKLIKGVGTLTAKSILKEFGKETKEIVLTDPDRLTKVSGISYSKAQVISERATTLESNLGSTKLVDPLIKQGLLVPYQANQLIDAAGDHLKLLLTEKPYQIHNFSPIDFAKIDAIAQSQNLYRKLSTDRIQGAIQYTLGRLGQGGHTCVPQHLLLSWASSLLADTEGEKSEYLKVVSDNIELMIRENLCISYSDHIYHPKSWSTESYIINRLKSMQTITDLQYSEALSLIQQTGVTLDKTQQEAAASALIHPFSCITGYPGTGKSSLIDAVAKAAKRLGWPVTLCAPTGKAANVLEEKTGLPASTIHRLLEATPDGEFHVNNKNPLPPGIIVVDEAPMVHQTLFAALLDAIPTKPSKQHNDLKGTILIFVGDPDQLWPVGEGKPYIDILDSQAFPVATLSKIYRTGQGSSIPEVCQSIRQGRLPEWPQDDAMKFFHHEEVVTPIVHHLLELHRAGIDSNDYQAIVPNKIGPYGAPIISWQFQNQLKPSGPSVNIGYRKVPFQLESSVDPVVKVYRGEKVRHTENNSDLNVFNGEVGVVIDLSPTSNTIEVKYPLKSETVLYDRTVFHQLDLATAMTVHSSQGSEWKYTVVGMYPTRLAERRLFYTASSRASLQYYLYGNQASIAKAIHNVELQPRYTLLAKRLKEYR